LNFYWKSVNVRATYKKITILSTQSNLFGKVENPPLSLLLHYEQFLSKFINQNLTELIKMQQVGNQ
jgi:hypothetical protein